MFNDYGRSHGLLKDKDENLSGADVREGLICVISVKLQEAEFEGQTKAKLGNTEIRTLVSNMVYSKLMEFFEENPGVAKAIFEKATQAARARAAAKKARELVRRKSASRPAGCPASWPDCREKDPTVLRSSSSRVILQAARPRWAVTRPFRPSSPCGVRCSTSKRPVPTASTATTS